MALSLELCRGKQLWNICVQTDSLCPRLWDRNHQQSPQSSEWKCCSAWNSPQRPGTSHLAQGSSDDFFFPQLFLWLVCLWVFVLGFGVVFFFKAIFQSHSAVFPQVKTQLLIVGVSSWWGCEAEASFSGNPTQHTKTLLQSVIYRLNGKSNSPTQIFGLLFVPGRALEAHTHEQIEFGFVKMGEAKERQSWVWAKPAQERQRLLPGLCPGVQGWSSSTGSFITAGWVDSRSLIKVYIKDGCWLWRTAQGRISHG